MASFSTVQIGQVPILCQLCEVESKIRCKCVDCELLMCTKCKEKVHPKFKNSADHRIVDLKDIGDSEVRECICFSDIKCRYHANQSCCLYCETCKQLICVKCISKIHYGHSFVDEDEIHIKYKKLKDKQEDNRKRTIEILSGEEETLKHFRNVENSKYVIMKKAILHQRSLLVEKADNDAEKLIQELDQKMEEIDQVVGEEQKRLDIIRTSLKEEEQESVSGFRSITEFLDDFDKLSLSVVKAVPQFNFTFPPGMPEFVPANVSQSDVGELKNEQIVKEATTQFEMKVASEFSKNLRNFHFIVICPDITMWVGDSDNDKVQHIKFKNGSFQTISSFNTKVYGLAVCASSEILLSVNTTSLKRICEETQQITDTKYSVSPLHTFGIHATEDKKILVCARSQGPTFSDSGRSVVIVMDETGNHLKEFEHDSDGKPLFTIPLQITSTGNGNIWVVDSSDVTRHSSGRVVILGQEGDIRDIYSGQDVNINMQFKPRNILTTFCDNVFVADMATRSLHVFKSDGEFAFFLEIADRGVIFPYSQVMALQGKLYI